jgi:hypothetical protein
MGRETERIAPLKAYLSVIRDSWVERNKLHPLEEVIIISIPAVFGFPDVPVLPGFQKLQPGLTVRAFLHPHLES